MESQRGYRVAVVGAGPRGTSVLERLVANHRDRGETGRVHIHLIDPYPPGPGHVWRAGQSRLFLMNTPSLFPTVVPTGELGAAAVAGMSFEGWRSAVVAGSISDVPPEDVDEARSLTASDFPSRALYGRYLAWTFARLNEAAGNHVVVHVHATEATHLHRITDLDTTPAAASVYTHTAGLSEIHYAKDRLFVMDADGGNVTQLTDDRLEWVAEIAGVKRQWEAKILEQVPDRKVAWAATEGATNAGAVYFVSAGPDRTQVTLELEHEGGPYGAAA